MIDNRQEYQRMFEVERQLWWYQILHRKVLSQITSHFRTHYSDLKILDAACGTGGYFLFWRKKVFKILQVLIIPNMLLIFHWKEIWTSVLEIYEKSKIFCRISILISFAVMTRCIF